MVKMKPLLFLCHHFHIAPLIWYITNFSMASESPKMIYICLPAMINLKLCV